MTSGSNRDAAIVSTSALNAPSVLQYGFDDAPGIFETVIFTDI